MTNKTLAIVIIIIVLAGAAGAGYYYWQQTRPLVVPMDQTMTDQNNQDASPTPTDSTSPTGSTASTPTPTAIAGACVRDFDQTKLDNNSSINIQNREVAINVKGFGTMTLEFYPSDAPKTVENFLRLTDAGYYDCLTFHRVSKGFVIQGGDPTGTGSGGQSAYGAPFADELNPSTASYKAGYVTGVLAMANSGPNTNGSQFFIMLADNTTLPHAYTIFGKVTMGLDVVQAIGNVPITPEMGPTDGSPVTPVVMQSVKIIK
jgi:cyclophilin family peptidyl-prolyl cis-trans isomerase